MATARDRRRAAGLFPSRDVDVKTALELFSWNHYRFARSTERFGDETIAAVLAELVRSRGTEAAVVFLRSAVDDAALQRTWRDAVNALKIFGSLYPWGSKQKREKLRAIAQAPRLLAATQAAAGTGLDVPDEYLAVLVLDGSDESVDALLPHFDRAMKDPARLDSLERLASYAKKTPALEALLRQVDARLAQRKSASPVLELAAELGIDAGERFRVSVQLHGARRLQLDVTLDSAKAEHFRVWVQAGELGALELTHFDGDGVHRDDLGLGGTELGELPAWLARAEKKLKVKWDRAHARASYLRGKRLAVFLDWLLSPGWRAAG